MTGITAAQVLLFVTALGLAIIAPGPAIIAASRSAVARGRVASMPYAMGLGFGASLWCLGALFGLTAAFHAVPALFTTLKLGGGAYLLWIGWKMLRHAADPLAMEAETVTGPGFVQGVALNLSNPKPALFYAGLILSVFPDPGGAGTALFIYALALTVELCFYAAITSLMATGPVRRRYIAAKIWIDRVAGVLIALLGASLVLSILEATS